MQSLLHAHDAIAQKDFYPHLPELPVEMDEDEETIKIVQLVKSNEPLVSTDFNTCFTNMQTFVYTYIHLQFLCAYYQSIIQSFIHAT